MTIYELMKKKNISLIEPIDLSLNILQLSSYFATNILRGLVFILVFGWISCWAKFLAG